MMHPDKLSVEQRASEYTHWWNFFAASGLGLPMFSDDPQAIIFMPLTLAQGPAQVAALRKLGRDLLAFADSKERELGGPVQTTTAALPVDRNTPQPAVAPASDARLDRLEAMLAGMAAKLANAPDPEPHRYTEPTPGEHAVAPLAPR